MEPLKMIHISTIFLLSAQMDWEGKTVSNDYWCLAFFFGWSNCTTQDRLWHTHHGLLWSINFIILFFALTPFLSIVCLFSGTIWSIIFVIFYFACIFSTWSSHTAVVNIKSFSFGCVFLFFPIDPFNVGSLINSSGNYDSKKWCFHYSLIGLLLPVVLTTANLSSMSWQFSCSNSSWKGENGISPWIAVISVVHAKHLSLFGYHASGGLG